MRAAIDRALELAPDSAELLLTANGVLLVELPRILVSDAIEGERLLHRALEVAGFANAERALAARSAGEQSMATAHRLDEPGRERRLEALRSDPRGSPPQTRPCADW